MCPNRGWRHAGNNRGKIRNFVPCTRLEYKRLNLCCSVSKTRIIFNSSQVSPEKKERKKRPNVTTRHVKNIRFRLMWRKWKSIHYSQLSVRQDFPLKINKKRPYKRSVPYINFVFRERARRADGVSGPTLCKITSWFSFWLWIKTAFLLQIMQKFQHRLDSAPAYVDLHMREGFAVLVA